MPNIENVLRTPAAGVLAVLALTSFGLAACGGSSESSSNAAATSASTAATSTKKASPSGASTVKNGGPNGVSDTKPARRRFSTMRACLTKNGVTLPAPSTGSNGTRGGFLGALAGGRPKGVTRAQLQAAIAKCGGGRFGGPGRGGGNFRRANSPVFKKALATYSACLRQNGVNVPAPNTSGKGPVFNTKGLNTSSPQFKSATAKCRGVLFSSLRARGRAPGA